MPIIIDPPYDPGATVLIDRLWLNLFDDRSVSMSFRVSVFSPKRTVDGDARTGASGRIRWIRRKGKPRTMQATLVRPSPAQRAWLDQYAGELVVVRDPDGGKFIGVYPEIGWDRPVEGADVSVAFQQITASEAV